MFSPFSVTPKKAVLNVNEVIEIKLSFESDITGDFCKSMIIRYETGIVWFILKCLFFHTDITNCKTGSFIFKCYALHFSP